MKKIKFISATTVLFAVSATMTSCGGVGSCPSNDGGKTIVSTLVANETTVSLNGVAQRKTVTLTATNGTVTITSLPSGMTYTENAATTCNPLPLTLQIGQSCTYTVGYASAHTGGTDPLNFGYNNNLSQPQQTSVTANTIPLVNYAYSSGLNGHSDQCSTAPGAGNIVYCTQQGALDTLWGASTPSTYQVTFAFVGDTQYAYIPSAGLGVARCTLNNIGQYITCENTGIAFTNAEFSNIAFNTVNNTQYAYVVDSNNYAVYTCNINPDGTFTGCVTNNLCSGNGGCTVETQAITFNNSTGTNYAYVTDKDGSVQAYTVNNDGTLAWSAGAITTGGTYGINFQSINGTTYVYIGNSNKVQVCTINQINGAFINCTDTGTGAVDLSTSSTVYGFGFAWDNSVSPATLYAYPATEANQSDDALFCTVNLSTGALENCNWGGTIYGTGTMPDTISGMTWAWFEQQG